ncbi:RNA methyltransferase tRNA(m5U54)methyltransferase [Didymosphaeria variabile]|uniref:tRNA (guanine(26)-N(2))-dimethyltransferase n=1 Tax=Didymosphaeria variabile TaxID=1932322 RepID=A0A9W8XFM9_9PLEO|nr:RNA methyltransferase tRNA(m5U54)methyltransferase [Didymosphaeria variabile]KAJ4349764.1 RNA methyltransferase tRNA(m5U54)methyltransferase [Didymosphaeria variabile]
MVEPQPVSIEALPRAGQSVQHEGKEYTTINEGLAHILVPYDTPTSLDPNMSKEDTQKQQVFYNPIQQFNRDLSVLAIKTFGEDSITRKQERHDQQKKKADRKNKKRVKNDVASNESAPETSTVQLVGAAANKRKLDDGEAAVSTEESAAKRRKSVQDNTDAAMSGTEDVNAAASETERPTEQSPWRPPFSILDALSATGLRALRYANEIPFATSITANDMSEKATQSIALNVKHNRLENKIQAHTGNAIAYMYSFCDKKGYDVIDLDPYGTASPFIDSAIQAINDDGLLCVTCTDSAIFASHGYLEKTFSLYGGLPLTGDSCHEGGLRLVLHAIAQSAGRYGMAIEPLLSLSIDYYIRVFVRVRKSPNDVKFLAGKTMLVYHCDAGCGAWKTQPLARHREQKAKNNSTFYKHGFAHGPSANEHCEHCGFKTHVSGPMFGGPLHNPEFIKRVLAQLKVADRTTYPTMDRIEGMLHTALEETTFGAEESASKSKEPERLDALIPKADPAVLDHHPFFTTTSSLSRVVHCSAPPTAAVRGALRHAGFRVTMSHCRPGSIKTDASWRDMWHIMLEWVRQRAPLKNALKQTSAGHAIMSKGSAHQKASAGQRPKEITDVAAAAEISAAELQTTGDGIPERTLNGAIAGTGDAEQQGSEGNGELTGTKGGSSDRPSYLGVNFEVKFDERLGKDQDRGKYVRYQVAPRENWGPMSRAK